MSIAWFFPIAKSVHRTKKMRIFSSRVFILYTWPHHVLSSRQNKQIDRLNGIAWNLYQIESRIFFKSICKNPIQVSWCVASILDDTKKNWMKFKARNICDLFWSMLLSFFLSFALCLFAAILHSFCSIHRNHTKKKQYVLLWCYQSNSDSDIP